MANVSGTKYTKTPTGAASTTKKGLGRGSPRTSTSKASAQPSSVHPPHTDNGCNGDNCAQPC